jgi:beta-1,2-mannobiose phosphorylase / 1,2-beta-oligomannan phosphorylase
MLNVKKEGIIIRSSGLGFENMGVLNPAIMQEGNTVHVFYRAVATGNYSTIGYARLDGPLNLVEQFDKPVIFPQSDEESQGVEDPRIVKIDGVYYLTYTAYDGVNALGALATSTDLKCFEKYGLITPQIQYKDFKRFASSKGPFNEKYLRYNKRDSIRIKHHRQVYLWSKNVMFFPRRIHNNLCFIQRIRPDIQFVSVGELADLTKEFWEDYFHHLDEKILLEPKYKHEVSYIGGGCPPIETPQGWLLIYHGVHDTTRGYVYSACAALLDLNDPTKEIARLPHALFSPEFAYELTGEVNNVCFPTGTALFDDTLYIYYGAADDQIACASMSLNALINELLLNTVNHA